MKRLAILAVAALMVMTVLAACNGTTTSPSPKPSTSQAAASPSAPAVSPSEETKASPKESSKPEDIIKGLSKDGYWIFSILSDVTLDKELVVEGEFHDKDDASKDVYRKFALYAQDAEHKITSQYKLTVPKITVKSPNFKISNGEVIGDISVEADGFILEGTKVTGNLIFKTQEQLDAYNADTTKNTGTVSGETKVG